MRVSKASEERRQEILDAAMRVFYEKGYEKTSISDIALKLGVAQGLIYRYFQIETFFCQLSGVGAHFLGFFGMVGYAMNGIDPPFHVIIGYGNSYFFFVYIHFKIRIT